MASFYARLGDTASRRKPWCHIEKNTLVEFSGGAFIHSSLFARFVRCLEFLTSQVISNNFKITAPPESELHGKRKVKQGV